MTFFAQRATDTKDTRTLVLVGEAEKAGHVLFAARVKGDSAKLVFYPRRRCVPAVSPTLVATEALGVSRTASGAATSPHVVWATPPRGPLSLKGLALDEPERSLVDESEFGGVECHPV